MTPPNIVTLLRIATAPILIWILMYSGPAASWLAAGVFLIATVSDFFDGYLARNYDSVTTLGKFLDPMADKLVVATVLIMLAGMARTPHVPAWMVVVLVTREIMVTGLRAVAAAEGLIVAAEELGKYKMALQSIAIEGLLIHYTYWHVDFFAAGMFVLCGLLCARGHGAAAKTNCRGGQAGGDLTGAASPDNQMDSSRRFGERV
jgi:CDP-diacylglycerol--glycerol-3-phosphate 3-phosphatidyltransferase